MRVKLVSHGICEDLADKNFKIVLGCDYRRCFVVVMSYLCQAECLKRLTNVLEVR